MNKVSVIKIIKEEIGGFDFLGNEEYLKEQENVDLLQNEEFQKQFIIDSITNFKEKIDIIEVETQYLQEPDYSRTEDGQGSDSINLEYFITVKYNYMGNEVTFKLSFYADNLTISWSSWSSSGDGQFIAPEGETDLTDIDWGDITPILRSMDDDDIDFTAFDKAGGKTQELFVRSYMDGVVTSELNMDSDKRNKPEPYSTINVE
jgi:hypothetical protein